MEWTPTLIEIKQKVEDYTGGIYNAVLVNLYENGNQVSNWHSDDDPWLDFPVKYLKTWGFPFLGREFGVIFSDSL